MKCTNCGTNADGKFCPYCGAPLNEETMTKKQSKAAQKKSKPKKPFFKRAWVWILIVLIVISIVIGSSGGKSENSFSKGFQAGMEAAKEPTADATAKPQESEPTPKPTPEPTPVLEGEFGVDANGNSGPDRIALITYAQMALEDILKQKVDVITWECGEDDWDITRTLNRYVLKGRGEIDDAPYDIIIKLEFDETYETYTVFQLKIDGKTLTYHNTAKPNG